jgi:hypothetical protein
LRRRLPRYVQYCSGESRQLIYEGGIVKLEPYRSRWFLIATLVALTGAGPAAAQESDDCYPIPAEGCDVGDGADRVDDDDDGTNTLPGDESTDGGDDLSLGGGADINVQSGADTDVVPGVLARTGVSLEVLGFVAALALLLGGTLLTRSRRRRTDAG